jgi:hypothetical protein
MARRNRDEDEDDDLDIPRVGRPRNPETFGPAKPRKHESEEYWRRMQGILHAVEVDDIARDVRIYMQGVLRRCDILRKADAKRFRVKGEERVILLLRTIVESANGPQALTLPIVVAVDAFMKTPWADLGLRWLEALDQVDLLATHKTLADLGLEDQFERVLRRKLEAILGPPVVPKPMPRKSAKKLSRPANVSEQAWSQYLRF